MSRPWPACSASPIRCASSTSVFFGPPPIDLPREPHEPPPGCAFPIELLVLACLVVGIVPALTIGPFLDTAVRVGARRERRRTTASPSGMASPAAADEHRRAGRRRRRLSLLLQALSATGGEGPPLLRTLKGAAIFRARARQCCRGVARDALESAARHAPSAAAAAAACCCRLSSPPAARSTRRAAASAAHRPATIVDPAFALVWLVGIACALGAAYQAKFHRLAALILLGGAGLVTCITSSGSRRPTSRYAAARRDRDHGPAPARPALAAEAVRGVCAGVPTRVRASGCAAARDLRHRGRRRRRHGARSPMRS